MSLQMNGGEPSRMEENQSGGGVEIKKGNHLEGVTANLRHLVKRCLIVCRVSYWEHICYVRFGYVKLG